MGSGPVNSQPMALTAREPPNLSQALRTGGCTPVVKEDSAVNSWERRREGSQEAQLPGSFPRRGGWSFLS